VEINPYSKFLYTNFLCFTSFNEDKKGCKLCTCSRQASRQAKGSTGKETKEKVINTKGQTWPKDAG